MTRTLPRGGTPRFRRHHDIGIVEPERGRPAVMLVHGILSPIRNCSARSRRIWGSIGDAVDLLQRRRAQAQEAEIRILRRRRW